MLDLAKEGLVEAVRNKGFRVTELSDRDLDELTEIRRLIEVPTVARLADSGRAAELRAAPARSPRRSSPRAERGDLLAYVDADLRFHLELLALSGNAHLVEVVRDLRNRARLYGLSQLSAARHAGRLGPRAPGAARRAQGRRRRAPPGSIMGEHIQHVRGIWASDA